MFVFDKKKRRRGSTRVGCVLVCLVCLDCLSLPGLPWSAWSAWLVCLASFPGWSAWSAWFAWLVCLVCLVGLPGWSAWLVCLVGLPRWSGKHPSHMPADRKRQTLNSPSSQAIQTQIRQAQTNNIHLRFEEYVISRVSAQRPS